MGKMSEPSFDGIKHALLDPKHCIIRSPQTPPAFPTEQITKLSIKSNYVKISLVAQFLLGLVHGIQH